jgi:hypothetical protein
MVVPDIRLLVRQSDSTNIVVMILMNTDTFQKSSLVGPYTFDGIV